MDTCKKIIGRTVFLGIVSLLAIINVSCGQNDDEKINELNKANKINELLSLYSDYEGFNGSVLVAHEGEVIYKKGFGLANMEWNIPNQVDTKFQIASITKQFTAMLIMQLVAENKLDLHKPISTYLPEYPKENANQITIHHLLTHSSGLNNGSNDGKKYNRPKDMVNQFANEPLQFKSGERFEYSNSGYTLLGYIIETITKKSYGDVLHERIFKPLQMKNSGFYKHRPLIKYMASGYYRNFGEYYDNDNSDESSAYAAGAIYSTVEDLFLWDQALNTEILLPKKYMDLIFVKHILDSDAHYGYGWELRDKPIGNTSKTIETVGHSGSIGGFRTLYTRIPSLNASIILLNNTSHSFRSSITTAITGILYDKPYDLPLIPLAKFMVEIIEKEGINKGIQFYKEHKNSPEYHVSEQELIVAGYRLLHAGNAKDAAEVFKLSTEGFPDKDNPYDSYAEALMTLGKNEEAIENYKKSLELNPNNNNAKKMLEKLGVDGNTSNDILETDSSWGKEIFTMPLHFAKDINLKGIEDARFPKGWNDTTSLNFWSYAFAWNVNLNTELTTSQLEDYLKKYYDGLLSGVNKEKNLVLPKTVVEITKNKDGHFIGKATIYDTFVIKKPLVLNFRVNQRRCEKRKKSIVVFKISPAAYNTEIWNTLKKIKLRDNICDF